MEPTIHVSIARAKAEAIESALRAFQRKYPQFADEAACDNCYFASIELLKELQNHYVPCHLLHCEIARFQLSDHAHPRIPDITIMPPRDEWFHYLVFLEDGSLVLDPTARQYDRRENPVRKLSLVQLQKEWLYYWAEPVDPN